LVSPYLQRVPGLPLRSRQEPSVLLTCLTTMVSLCSRTLAPSWKIQSMKGLEQVNVLGVLTYETSLNTPFSMSLSFFSLFPSSFPFFQNFYWKENLTENIFYNELNKNISTRNSCFHLFFVNKYIAWVHHSLSSNVNFVL